RRLTARGGRKHPRLESPTLLRLHVLIVIATYQIDRVRLALLPRHDVDDGQVLPALRRACSRLDHVVEDEVAHVILPVRFFRSDHLRQRLASFRTWPALRGALSGTNLASLGLARHRS